MKKLLLLSILFAVYFVNAQEKWQGKSVDFSHGKLIVSENHRFLVFENGTPFFYLGDTAWELFHRLNKADAEKYLENRREKVKNYADDLGIKIEVGSKKMTAENLVRYIEIAAFFESPILRFVIDGDGFQPQLEEIQQIIKSTVPILEKIK